MQKKSTQIHEQKKGYFESSFVPSLFCSGRISFFLLLLLFCSRLKVKRSTIQLEEENNRKAFNRKVGKMVEQKKTSF